MVQWSALCTSIAGSVCLIPGQGTKFPQAAWHGQNPLPAPLQKKKNHQKSNNDPQKMKDILLTDHCLKSVPFSHTTVLQLLNLCGIMLTFMWIFEVSLFYDWRCIRLNPDCLLLPTSLPSFHKHLLNLIWTNHDFRCGDSKSIYRFSFFRSPCSGKDSHGNKCYNEM